MARPTWAARSARWFLPFAPLRTDGRYGPGGGCQQVVGEAVEGGPVRPSARPPALSLPLPFRLNEDKVRGAQNMCKHKTADWTKLADFAGVTPGTGRERWAGWPFPAGA